MEKVERKVGGDWEKQNTGMWEGLLWNIVIHFLISAGLRHYVAVHILVSYGQAEPLFLHHTCRLRWSDEPLGWTWLPCRDLIPVSWNYNTWVLLHHPVYKFILESRG